MLLSGIPPLPLMVSVPSLLLKLQVNGPNGPLSCAYPFKANSIVVIQSKKIFLILILFICLFIIMQLVPDMVQRVSVTYSMERFPNHDAYIKYMRSINAEANIEKI